MLSKILSKAPLFYKLSAKSACTIINRASFGLMTHRPVNYFSNNEKISDEKLEEIKRQGQEFYQTQLTDIIELKKLEDFNLIVKSTQVPLIVNFYASWNLACKGFTPRLQAKIKQSNGQVKLLNIDIDKFGEIVNVFQVKSVPTIFLVYKGKGLDSFKGDISDEMLNKFFQTVTRVTKFDQGESDVAKKLQQAQVALRDGDLESAEKILVNLKTSHTKEEFGFVKNIFLAYIYGQLGKITNLKSVVELMIKNEEFYLTKPQFKELYLNLVERCKQIQKAKQESSELVEWKIKLEKDPSNLQLKFDAATFYQQNELFEEALIQLLNIVKANKQWQDKKANKVILEIFKKLGNSSPITQNYRKLYQRALY